MNLLEEEVKKSSSNNNNGILKVAIIGIAVLTVLAIGIFVYTQSLKAKQFKLYIDGNQTKTTKDLFLFEDGDILISVNDFAGLVGYEFKKGKYKAYDEEKNKCHVFSKNREEVAGIEADSNNVYKIVLADNTTEYYNLNSSIKLMNGKLYTDPEGINIIFNTIFTYDSEKNSVTATTLDKLVNTYATANNNTLLTSEDMSYSNKKALKYGYMLEKNNAEEVGVRDLRTKDMVIESQYTSLKFMESTKDFIVTTPENKQGIKSVSGGVNINPQYDEIKQLDVEYDLYIVKNNEKYGVINRQSGKYIVYAEYDSIGVNTDNFDSDEISNQYILYDNCIPVKKIIEKVAEDEKVTKVEQWTLFDKEGNKISQNYYDGLGYIKGTSKTAKGNNLLLIPDIEGIVVYKDSKYGIINSVGRELIPVSLKEVYSVTSEGKSTYYMVYGNNNTVQNVLEFLDKLTNDDKNENKNNTTNKVETNKTVTNNTTTNKTDKNNTVTNNTAKNNTNNNVTNTNNKNNKTN